MKRITTLLLAVAFVTISAAIAAAAEIELAGQTRDARGQALVAPLRLDGAKTAVVVIDVWDNHWCKTHAARVAAMIPRMNRTLAAARKLGMQVVFAPSDVVQFYKDDPQRRAMLAIPPQAEPPLVAFAPPEPPGPCDHCECGPGQPCPKGHPWTRQHPGLVIAAADLIADGNNGRELLNLCGRRGIDTLLYMGAASNICVLHRQCGLLNMKRHGLRAIVVRDLVRAITANGIGADGRPDPNFTPGKGTIQVQRHIEQYIAPTIQSRQILAAAGMDPHAGDHRPHLVLAIAEAEYHTAETLPRFARKYLARDFRVSVVQGDPARQDMPGLEVLDEAEGLLLSMRRQALSAAQVDPLDRFIRSGKPLVVLRAAVTPFQLNKAKCPPGHVTWDRFDREVLGCSYQFYNPKSRSTGCDVWVEAAAAGHPILDGLPARFHSPSWLYRQRPLAATATLLLSGRWSTQDPDEPVAWTNSYLGGRVFYTTLGHPGDFQLEAFNRLLANGVRWAMGTP